MGFLSTVANEAVHEGEAMSEDSLEDVVQWAGDYLEAHKENFH